MSSITVYKCPACTGPVHFVGSSGLLECDYCGTKYEIEQMEALSNKVKDDVEKSEKADKTKKEDDGVVPEGYQALTCSACGAELFCDETTVATSCPYCGNPTIIPSKFTQSRLPDVIIPFKMDKQAAISTLKEFYKGKKLLPNTFKDENHIEEIKGVYVPFWLFSGKSKFDAVFECTDDETYTRGNERIIITKYYQETRSGEVTFRNAIYIPRTGPNAWRDPTPPQRGDIVRPLAGGEFKITSVDATDATQYTMEARET